MNRDTSTIDTNRAWRAALTLIVVFGGTPLLVIGAITQPHWTILGLLVIGMPAIFLPRQLRDDYVPFVLLLLAGVVITLARRAR